MEEFNVYCDESCHLKNDHQKVFVLGATWAKKDVTMKTFSDIREIKKRHGLSLAFEAKWTKVSHSKIEFYKDLVSYFFENTELHFRGVVVPDKGTLDHAAFSQDHDTWYYKMFYVLLNVVIKPEGKYNLYFDIKDTKSNKKVKDLKRILNIASMEDLSTMKAQQVRSHEVELMQLTDIFSGALAYKHRGLSDNAGKQALIELIENRIGSKTILTSTDREEDKFNVFLWNPKVTH